MSDDLTAPLAAELPKLKPADQATLTREYLTKKLPGWGKLKPPERESLVSEVVGKYGQVAQQKMPIGWEALKQQPERMLRALPLVATGAAAVAAPFTIPAQAAVGAGSSVVTDLSERLIDKLYGRESPSITPEGEAKSAAMGAIGGGLPAASEAGIGLGAARREVGAAQDLATKNAGDLANKQSGVRSDIAARQQDENARVAAKSQALQQRQAQIRQELPAQRGAVAATAAKEHEQALADIQSKVAQKRQELSEARTKALEKARPDIAERAATKEAGRMTGKTPAQLQAEEAQPYEQRSASLAAAKDPYFDASLRFHQEVGQKFEPYIGKVKNNPVSTDAMTGVRDDIARIKSTIAERGFRLESADLKQVLDLAGSEPVKVPLPNVEVQGTSLRHLAQTDPERARKLAEQLNLIPAQVSEPTYGELWGYRARENRVLARSRNPADRWAADQLVGKLTDTLPGVPDKVRQQYAFERGLMRDVTRDVAGARTPKEVGDAIFSSGTTEAPLQVIRFTKRYAPEKVAGLKESFADWYIGKGFKPTDIGKINPAVVRELYGKEADGIARLLGPEGDAKQRTVEQIISASPESKHEFVDAWQQEMGKHENLARRQAITDGEQALRELGPKYDSVRRALAAAKMPEAKLRILQQELPQPKQIAPTKAEAGVLAQQPQSQHEAGREALLSGISPARMERYAQHRLAFDTLIGVTSGMGIVAHHPAIAVSGFTALGARAGVRWALTTPRGAELYLKLLESRNAGLIAKGMAGMTASVVTSTAKDHLNVLGTDVPNSK